jgi:Fe2+ transport system protein FeoA
VNAPPPAPGSFLRASDLAHGARGLVTGVEAAPEVVERLAALGLAPGAVFDVRRAGSPMTVAIGASRLALGRTWADALRVVAL